jgi:transcriptional regulator
MVLRLLFPDSIATQVTDMYIPRLYRELDPATVEQFIRSNDFAVLVSHDGERPIATHLVLDLQHRADDTLVLNGHMARANPQWHSLTPGKEVLAIFSGPDAYISPRWYNHVNVPTWNYMAVHVYGQARIITEHDELYQLLKNLVDKYEAGSGATPPYRLETLPQDFVEQQMKAIVGFQIDVARIEASFKLSQNRDEQSYDSVVGELHRRTDEQSLAVAEAMEARRSRLFGAST